MASRTVYIRNLPEAPRTVKIDVLREYLQEIAEYFGPVVQIRANEGVTKRGQAWVTFEKAEAAQAAVQKLNGFDPWQLEGLPKKMEIQLARQPSDIAAENEMKAADFEKHKQHRLAEKQRREAAREEEKAKGLKRKAAETAAGSMRKAPKPAPKANAGVVPDEYLPPNKVLFVQNIPPEHDKDSLTELFARFAGLKEVRYVAVRHMAFVEYDNETAAIPAKDALNGVELAGQVIKVTYQRS